MFKNDNEYILYIWKNLAFDILFPTKVNPENDGDLCRACSNPTIVESHAALFARVNRLIYRTNQLWCSHYQTPLTFIISNTIIKIIWVGFEHALQRSSSFSRFTLVGERILDTVGDIRTFDDTRTFSLIYSKMLFLV